MITRIVLVLVVISQVTLVGWLYTYQDNMDQLNDKIKLLAKASLQLRRDMQ